MASIVKKGKDKYLIRVVIGYFENGNPNRKSRTVIAKNKTELDKKVALFIAELEQHGFVEDKGYTLRRFVEEIWEPQYASKPENLSTRTHGLYTAFIEERFLPTLGRKQLSAITTYDIARIMDGLKREDEGEGELSRSTKRNILYAIRSVFSLATRWNFIQRDPTLGITVGRDTRTEKKRYQPYTIQELTYLFECLAKEPLDMQVSMSIAIITGAREGEIAALEEKHIDWKNKTITLEQTIVQPHKKPAFLQHHTKTDAIKVVSVTDELIGLIRLYLEQRGDLWKVIPMKNIPRFLFCHPDGSHFRPDSFYQRFARFRKRYGIRKVRYHDLRHTSATYLLSQGVSMKVIQERLGHKDISTTMNIYAHVLKEVDQESADTFKKLLLKPIPATNLPPDGK